MNEVVHSETSSPNDPLEARMIRVMVGAVAVAVVVSAVLLPWRVTMGLLLGGLLSLFNYQWLRSSVAALIEANAAGRKVSARVSRYLLRYVVIAVVVFAAFELGLVALPATIVGLSSFVVALFAEAFREFYFAIVNREEIP
jgi:ATP synthase I chain